MTDREAPPSSSSPPTTREPANATGGLDPDPPDPGAWLRAAPPHTVFVFALVQALVFCRGDVLLLAVSALLIVSAWAAWMLARLDTRHRPVSYGLAAMAAMMLLREGLHAYVLHGGPYTEWARVAFHVEEGTRLVTAALPAWMALATLTKWPPGRTVRRVRGGLVGGVVTMLLILVVSYPSLRPLHADARAEWLRLRYLGADLAALLVAVLAILSWVRRRGWVSRIDDRSESAIDILEQAWGARARVGFEGIAIGAAPRWWTYGTVLALVVGDIVLLLFGAWRWGLFGAAYVVQQAGLLGVWGVVALLHGVALVMTRRRV